MKSIKALIAALALGVAASAPLAHAQQKKGGMTPEQQIERIEQAVGTLTADQKSKITAIIAKGREDMAAAPKEERKEKGMALQKNIRAVLTPEQQKKFDEMPPMTGGGGKKKKDQ